MSKMILLELTEKEFEMLEHAMLSGYTDNKKAYDEKNQEVYRKNMELCTVVMNKLEASYEPQEDVLITDKDLFQIKSLATNEYKKLPNNLYISGNRMEEKDLVHISLANALLMWLNGRRLLKKLAKFDYTDKSCQYEEDEE